jgi:hypothetical protein
MEYEIGNVCYKIRLSIAGKNKGKSGGARLITHLKIQHNTIILLSIYDKSEQSTITDEDLLRRIQSVDFD